MSLRAFTNTLLACAAARDSNRQPARLARAWPSPIDSCVRALSAHSLWGGFEYPLSKMSAIYQVVGGFIVLVLISSYTANLAAFITLSAQPTKSIQSMDQAQLDSASVRATRSRFHEGFRSV